MFFNIALVFLCCFHVRAYAEDADGCEPIAPSLTSPKTGQKARDKCVEYQETLVFPCEKNTTGDSTRANHCSHNADDDELSVGGTDAAAHEFSHMVLLGYGEESQPAWYCSGVLVSDRFILTVAHCAQVVPEEGPLAFAYIGALDRQKTTDPSKLYKIKSVVKHPEFKPPKKYHDIALLEIDRSVELNPNTVPACLHVGDDTNVETATESGWWRSQNTTALKKLTLTKFTKEECLAKYPPARNFNEGIDDASQLCYGVRDSDVTCQSLSGAALQIKDKEIGCMYSLIGIVSFGKSCNLIDVPSIYTRVSHYVPWIESVVWP